MILPQRPTFIYRKAPTLRNKLVPNILDPPNKQVCLQILKDSSGVKNAYHVELANKLGGRKTLSNLQTRAKNIKSKG